MTVHNTTIDGLLVFTPTKYTDSRGYFRETFNNRVFCDAIGRSINFVQDNESLSIKNVIRGLHFQAPPYAQGKLVHVVNGSVWDVAVDLRRSSPTYLQWHAELLTAENGKMFWMPEGFAHGFLTLEENTKFAYKCSNYYHTASEQTILWNDPTLNIKWKIDNPIVSQKDNNGLSISTFESPFE